MGSFYNAEMVRPLSYSLNIYGSVILNSWGPLFFNHNWKEQGFYKTFFRHDPRFSSISALPIGLPTTMIGRSVQLWSKGANGRSKSLMNAFAMFP